jgi:hypothetical protein
MTSEAHARSRAAGGIERLAPAIADHPAGLLEAEPWRGQVIGRVVEHLPAAHPLEFLPHPGHCVDQPRADLDHRVELPGGNAGHRESLRAELERAASDRGGVDQLAQHLHARSHRPPAKSVPPEHAPYIGGGAEQDRPAGAQSLPAPSQKPVTGLDLDHAADLHVGHRWLAVPEWGERGGNAGRLESRHRRARPVDRVHDQDVGCLRRGDQAAVLGVERQAGRPLRHKIAERRLRHLVHREGDVPARAVALMGASGVRSELR